MKSFNKTTKQKYIKRATQHREQDEIVQGLYWEDGKGCCVGCLSHANENAHEALEKQTGIPEWLSRVADTLHEGMEEKDSKKWPERFVAAVPTNMSHDDFEKKIKAPFLVMVLKSTLKNFDHKKYPDVKDAVSGAIKLWQRADIGSVEWSAESAERAARAASAARAAWAERAASAARAARAASAESAASAAWAAWAESAAYKKYANNLIKIMEKTNV